MYFLRNLLVYLILILFILSLYKDLTVGTPLSNENKSSHVQQSNLKDKENSLSGIQVRIQPGDTVLSITEQINHQLPAMDITQIIADFKTINPHTNPYDLQSDTIYYFPLY